MSATKWVRRKKDGESLAQSIENLVKLPLGTKLYLRVNWKDVQQRPGRLDLCEHWKLTFELARKYQKRIGFRVMMSNPDIPDSPLPEFLRDKDSNGEARRLAGPDALRAAL